MQQMVGHAKSGMTGGSEVKMRVESEERDSVFVSVCAYRSIWAKKKDCMCVY